jgi:8-oxo-dGTP pyrophosphatase MutT (NUDIX family)
MWHTMEPVRKAFGYVTRRRDGMTEALVFRHWHPEAGIQVPKGSVEPGESLAEAALREVREETGLADLVLVGEVAADTWVWDGVFYERHFFHLRATSTPDAWEHTVTGMGEDRGMKFSYFWIRRPDEVELVANHGDYLHLVLDGQEAKVSGRDEQDG